MSKAKRRRMKRIQRNRRIAILFCMLFCIVAVSLISGKTQATAHQETYKYYTDIRVGKDDTLWSIARKYRTEEYKSLDAYIAEVQQINRIGKKIEYGQILIVPYYSEELK